MKRLWWLVLAGVLITTPAVADHVNEPTAPVLDLRLEVLDYATQTFADCSGQEPFHFDKARIHAFATVAAAPSEHFTTSFAVAHEVVTPKGQTVVRKDWNLFWTHQNVPPHGASLTKFRPGGLTNTYGMVEGINIINVSVLGEESGNYFEQTCYVLVDTEG